MRRDQHHQLYELEREIDRRIQEETETMDELQILVGQWGRMTFPNATTDSILAHLAEEAVELIGIDRIQDAVRRAIDKGDYQPSDNPAEESADVLLMLFHLADRKGFSLNEATQKKFDEVRNAEWYDAGGYMKRVK